MSDSSISQYETDAPPVDTPRRRVRSADDIVRNSQGGYDLATEWVDDVFPDETGETCSVRIRSLTAEQGTRVKTAAIKPGGRGDTQIIWAQMEIKQFLMGVVEPAFSEPQVIQLHQTSGSSFQRVIAALDKISGIDKEDLRQAQSDFQDAGD